MPLRQISAPLEEPISLAEAKLHLRVDVDDDDALITTLIGAARQAAEMLTGRQLVTARWQFVMDCFPRSSRDTSSAGEIFSLPTHAIYLPKSPLQSVIGIDYLDLTGVLQRLSSEDYVIDASSEPARVTPAWARGWPAALPQLGTVSVTFDAGYGAAVSVPDGIKSWIKLRVGSLYACREELSTARIDANTTAFFNGLLDPFRVISL